MFLPSLRVLLLFICIAAAQQYNAASASANIGWQSFPDMIDATWDSKRSLSRWPKWLSDMPPLGYQPRRMTSQCIAGSKIQDLPADRPWPNDECESFEQIQVRIRTWIPRICNCVFLEGKVSSRDTTST
ncbi:hypothetical protein EV421DRAFT_502652 [Armillaria borealis]|uniref:Uncharacterized protein n=1 Tax=Armillaria borealis TaxID=47425 RepID=A0AA39IVB7_9AGAR|nr:hypothetical protein EV421DRAFT_502652 [Armillaria borealis]